MLYLSFSLFVSSRSWQFRAPIAIPLDVLLLRRRHRRSFVPPLLSLLFFLLFFYGRDIYSRFYVPVLSVRWTNSWCTIWYGSICLLHSRCAIQFEMLPATLHTKPLDDDDDDHICIYTCTFSGTLVCLMCFIRCKSFSFILFLQFFQSVALHLQCVLWKEKKSIFFLFQTKTTTTTA